MTATRAYAGESRSKKERILDAALSLFATRGFHGTAVPLVAKEAGVGAGTIYRYFQSKEHLVNELFLREKQTITAFVLGRDFRPSDPPREQFRHFFHRIVEYAVARPESFQFLEHHHHAPYLDASNRALEDKIRESALQYIQMLQTHGLARRVDPHVVYVFIWGTLVRLMRDAWDGTFELTDELVRAAEELCWEVIETH